MSLKFSCYLIISSLFLCFAFSCANQLPLTGGLKDETPPQIDTSESITNYQTNFAKQDIELVFNEYIDLRDASNQILISPPLSFPPKISSRLKKISIVFNDDEELKEKATYVVNFGKSIRDFTEGNELLNYSFVFSTGDYIDSLSMSGRITDAKSGDPREDVLVLLYTDKRDSVVYQDRPFYFARTDDEGRYRINNLRADTFKVAVMSDQNLSYTYDPGTEEIGFLDSLIVLEDTLTSNINLELFKEATQPRYKSYDVIAQGQAKIEFEGRITDDALNVIDSVRHFLHFNQGDQYLTLWYTPRNRKGLRYEVFRNEILDTVQLRVNTRSIDTIEGQIDITKLEIDSKVGLHPSTPLGIPFDRPIDEVALDHIFLVDTLANDTLNFSFDSLGTFPTMTLSLYSNWPKERTLNVTFYPGAITDFFGNTNDTISEFFLVATEVDFGNIQLEVKNSDGRDHVLQLMKDEKIVAEKIFHPGEKAVSFERLIPGAYSLQIIDDEVNNGYWDPGNYLEKRQSEKIYKVPLGELRPNWEMEEQLDMKEIKSISMNPPVNIESDNR